MPNYAYYFENLTRIGFGMRGQLDFDSSQLSSRAHEGGSGSAPDTADSVEEEELPDEEVGAEVPVIISGSFLNCRPVRHQSHDQLICNALSGPVPDTLRAGLNLEGQIAGEVGLITAVGGLRSGYVKWQAGCY